MRAKRGDLRVVTSRSLHSRLEEDDLIVVVDLQESDIPSLDLCVVMHGSDVLSGISHTNVLRMSRDVDE